jgi:hypothetical protein
MWHAMSVLDRPQASWVAVALAGSLVMAAVSTLGDVVWFELHLPHRVIYGLAHGALLCLAIGLYLGIVFRQPGVGAGAGTAIGLAAAGAYYAVAPLTGYGAMFVIWMALWVLFAWLADRLRGGRSGVPGLLVRGLVSSVASGLAFYAISGIWLERPSGGRNYVVHFLSWTIAFVPAFAVLLYPRRSRG